MGRKMTKFNEKISWLDFLNSVRKPITASVRWWNDSKEWELAGKATEIQACENNICIEFHSTKEFLKNLATQKNKPEIYNYFEVIREIKNKIIAIEFAGRIIRINLIEDKGDNVKIKLELEFKEDSIYKKTG